MSGSLCWITTCDAEIDRQGQPEPCEETAVAMVYDDEGNRPWAVCKRHIRGRRLVPLTEVVAWARA